MAEFALQTTTTASKEFNRVTSKMLSHMRERFAAKIRDGRVVRPARPIPFDLSDLRAWMRSRETAADVWRCKYCQKHLVIGEVEPDHNVPVKRGGGLGLDNLDPVCKLCNQTKGELTGEEYDALIEGLHSFPQAAEIYVLKCLRTAAMGARVRFFPRPGKKAPPAPAETEEF